MGLNIGVEVRKQAEGYMCEGSNPRGSIEEIEKDFFAFLSNRFPEGGFGGGWVSLKPRGKEEWYDFDVRLFGYGKKVDVSAMYLAITEYIFSHFSHVDGIEMRTYWSG